MKLRCTFELEIGASAATVVVALIQWLSSHM